MLQSVGNVIDPATVIDGASGHGADVLRLWVASTDYTRDVLLGPSVLARSSEALKKIRNTARFLLGNLVGIAGTGIVVKGASKIRTRLPSFGFSSHKSHVTVPCTTCPPTRAERFPRSC